MKKLALILALFLIPCSAFGLEMLTDNALDNVTGQAGVSIAADDIQIFLNVERFAWIDSDGFGSKMAYGGTAESTIGGAIFIDNFQLDMLNINMIGGRGTLAAYLTSDLFTDGTGGIQSLSANALGGSSAGVIELFYDYGNTNTMGAMLTGSYTGLAVGQTNTLGMDNYINPNQQTSLTGFLAKSITIDASAELPLHTPGFKQNAVTFFTDSKTVGGVIIGFPTMEIYIGSMIVTPRFTSQISSNGATVITNCYNEGQSYGTFEMQGITFSVLSGWMEIAPTGRPGDGF
jgi:hypothetical protein